MGTTSKSPRKKGKKKKVLIPDTQMEERRGGDIPIHKHCFNCGKPVDIEKDICSDKCQEEWDRMLKRKKMLTYLPIIGGVLLILFYILIMSQGG